MGKSNLFSAVLSLFLLVSASITWAQTISSQKGLTTAEFNLPQGKIKVYLPDNIRPGDVISGTIVTEPVGKNAKQTEKNLAELIKSNIVIDGNKIVLASKSQYFSWLVRSYRQTSSPIELIDVSGQKDNRALVPLQNGLPLSEQPCLISSHAMVNSPVRIRGDFDGNSSNTQCMLDNKPLEVLAESPRQCIIQYPENGNGFHTLAIKENGKATQACEQKVSGVKMDVSAGKLDLHKGEQTYIDIQITGLQNLPAKAVLSLENLSGSVVTMLPENNIVIPLFPDSVGPGIFKKRFDIQSLKTGSFIVNVNLDLPDEPSPVQFEIPRTGGEKKLDTIPCQELEAMLKAKEDELAKLKDELAGIDGQIRNAKLALLDCKEALEALLKDYWAAKDKFDFQDRRIGYWKTDKKDVPADVQKDYDDSKKDKDGAARKWSEQNKKCKDLEEKIAQLESRKLSLPGIIKSFEEEIGKLKDAIEKCKQKEAEEKKKKEEEERRKTEAQPSGETTRPGETDKGKEGSPCNPNGATLTETKRVYDPCEVESTEVTPCGVGKMENAGLDAIKNFLEKFKKISKPLAMAEKLAECASTAKTICINIHIIRKWKDIEYKYECINGKWVLMNKRTVNHGEDDYGWFKVEDKTIGCCWIFDGSKAMEQELANKIQDRLDQCR